MVIMMMLMLLISINDFGGDDAAAYDGDGDDNGKYVAIWPCLGLLIPSSMRCCVFSPDTGGFDSRANHFI